MTSVAPGVGEASLGRPQGLPLEDSQLGHAVGPQAVVGLFDGDVFHRQLITLVGSWVDLVIVDVR